MSHGRVATSSDLELEVVAGVYFWSRGLEPPGPRRTAPSIRFLSEDAEFAKACAAANIAFIGPTPETISQFGDKTVARNLAQSLGVPVLAGPQAPFRRCVVWVLVSFGDMV